MDLEQTFNSSFKIKLCTRDCWSLSSLRSLSSLLLPHRAPQNLFRPCSSLRALLVSCSKSLVVAVFISLSSAFSFRIFRTADLNLFRREVRHACPLESHYSYTEKGGASWDQLLANKEGASVNWFPRWKEGRARVLIPCGGFPNVPLMGTRGCISYNLVLAIRQLGYPMRGEPLEEELTPVIS